MKVIIELIVDKCSDCPNCVYNGTYWGEDVYSCKKIDSMIDPSEISKNCPYIESTINKLTDKLN